MDEGRVSNLNLEAIFDIGRHIPAKAYGGKGIGYKVIAKELGGRGIATKGLPYIFSMISLKRGRSA